MERTNATQKIHIVGCTIIQQVFRRHVFVDEETATKRMRKACYKDLVYYKILSDSDEPQLDDDWTKDDSQQEVRLEVCHIILRPILPESLCLNHIVCSTTFSSN